MNKKRLIEICQQVAIDVKNDAVEFDGKPFTGKTMAEYMGYHGAAISALANVLEELLSSDPNVQVSDTTDDDSSTEADQKK